MHRIYLNKQRLVVNFKLVLATESQRNGHTKKNLFGDKDSSSKFETGSFLDEPKNGHTQNVFIKKKTSTKF